MPTPIQRPRMIPHRPGFALVVALGLMAFMFLLVMGLSSQLLVQNQLTTVRTQQALARQNALVGVHIALGQLQRAAGPDQRATATADILTTQGMSGIQRSEQKKRWTGVWRTDQFGAQSPNDPTQVWTYNSTTPARLSDWFQGWLVSGNNAALNDLAFAGSAFTDYATNLALVTLVGDGSLNLTSPDDHVRVPRESIVALNPQAPTGNFAYWVGDEGVKARINLFDPVTADRALTQEEQIARLMAPARLGIELIRDQTNARLGSGGFDPEAPVNRAFLESLVHPAPLHLSDNPVLQNLARDGFDSITFNSSSILADAYRGGLKRDLSLAAEMPKADYELTEFVQNGETRTWDLSVTSTNTTYLYDVNYLYRHWDGSISQSVSGGNNEPAVARGPTWELLRNFMRLHKPDLQYHYNRGTNIQFFGTQNSLNNPTIIPRPALPQVASSNIEHATPGRLSGTGGDDARVRTHVSGLRTLPPPTYMQIAPVVTRNQYVFSLDAVDEGTTDADGNPLYRVRVYMDQLVTVWNPYSIAITIHGIHINSQRMLGDIGFVVQRPSPNPTYYWGGARPPGIDGGTSGNMIAENMVNPPNYGKTSLWLNADGTPGSSDWFTLEPGEVVIFSNSNPPQPMGSSSIQHLARGLPDLTTDGGLIMDRLAQRRPNPTSVETVFDTLLVTDQDNLIVKMQATSDGAFAVDMQITYGPQANAMGNPTGNRMLVYGHNVSTGAQTYAGGGVTLWPPSPPGSVDSGITGFPVANILSSGGKIPFATVGIDLRPEDSNDAGRMFVDASPRSMSHSRSEYHFWRPHLAPGGIVNPNGYYSGSALAGGLMFTLTPGGFFSNLVNGDPSTGNGFWGGSYLNVSDGSSFIPKYDIPRVPILSMGMFQHLNFTFYGNDADVIIGQSFANPHIPRDNVRYTIVRTDTSLTQYRTFIDNPFLANDAIWDGYFLSGLMTRGTGYPDYDQLVIDQAARGFLDNPRLKFPEANNTNLLINGTEPSPEAYRLIAELVYLDGGFNINSTSLNAWRALLASTLDLPVVRDDGGLLSLDTVAEGIPFVRHTIAPGAVATGNDSNDYWSGYRVISQNDIDDLAQAVVDQVRRRGPFLSVSDFVNRRLSTGADGLTGTLQAAIDDAGLNNVFSITLTNSDLSPPPPGSNYPFEFHRAGDVATGAPAYLMQSDILNAIGSSLTTRSDTFLIRAYGDVLDPLTGETLTRAWCEAVVQRTPGFVDPIDEPSTRPEMLSAINQQFGRQFSIISVRWLHNDDV